MKRLPWLMGFGLLAMCLAATGCKPPVADFSASLTSDTAPSPVQFTDTSTPGGSSIKAWHWLFGDGTESAEQNPAHVYLDPGTYNVSLEVTTSAGSDTALKLNLITVGIPNAGTVETIMLPGDVPLEMVWIPGGAFTMGSPDTEKDGHSDEGPQHTVTFASGFWMGKNELTKRQWQAVMATMPWIGQSNWLDDPDSPAVYVSWEDAQDFLTGLNDHTGRTFRLPSEAQWEYACRAGTISRFYWGNDSGYTAIGDYAWYVDDLSGNTYAHVVGGKTANAFSLYDMNGNVSEWCQDWLHGNYVGAPTDGSAWETPSGQVRVLRGGMWGSIAKECRSARRNGCLQDIGGGMFGFRVVRTP